MVAREILKADFLDLLFDDRNKQYGAYLLRRTYRKRLWMALAMTLVLGTLVFWYVQLQTGEKDAIARMNVREVVLQNIEEVEPPPPPPPPPETKAPEPPKAETPAPSKPKIVQPKVATTKFTPPVIKKDNEVKKTEVPPVKNIATVSVVTTKGAKANNVIPALPPVKSTSVVDHGTGVVKAPPKKKVDENKIFEKVEIEASVNLSQWRRHLLSRLQRYIEDAAYDGMAPGTYTVNVRFLVEKDGSISHVKALNNPGYGLARGAVQVVKTGPKWRPGEQNGRKVRSYHTQPITFVISAM
ncbi:MAG TPA: energy transducer TonB [Flavisolibacter sp.]|nr:energy transducer TonB [Flavisolibacter sp.]